MFESREGGGPDGLWVIYCMYMYSTSNYYCAGCTGWYVLVLDYRN